MSTFTIVYNANGPFTGTLPVDSNVYSTNPNIASGQATVATPASNFVSGSDTFNTWNTVADGTGNNVWAPGSTLTSTIAGTITLYAQWWTTNNLTGGGLSTPKGLYQFYYDRALAGTAFSDVEPGRTNSILNVIETDHETLSNWFGGTQLDLPPPVSCYIVNQGGGASWGGQIHFYANGLDSNGIRYLFYSEVSEIFMRSQQLGWYDDSDEQSCGEALSRFLGTQFLESVGLALSDPAFSGYQTSYCWLNSSLPTSNPNSTQTSNYPQGPIGTLPAAITDVTSTSITITGGFTAPYEPSFVVQIDNEQMLVTATTPSSKTEVLTVTRGYNGTTAATHAINAPVLYNYGSRADYVNTTLKYDVDIDAAVGCSTLFIYYLNVNLGFSVARICQAAPGQSNAKNCLRGVYQNLTQDTSDPFPFFQSLLNYAFPPEQVFSSNKFPNPDNPFPIGILSFYGAKNQWGRDEVNDILSKGGVYQNAFWLALSGFNLSVVGSAVPTTPSIPFNTTNGATAVANESAITQTNNPAIPQLIRFGYDMHFNSTAPPSFPSSGEDTVLVTSQITVLNTAWPTQDDFYFIAGANPYFTNVIPTPNPADENQPWLSADVRVFTATPALNQYPIPSATSIPFTTDSNEGAWSYISQLIPYFNKTYGDPNGPDPFAANSNVILNEELSTNGDSSVTQFHYVGNTQYNNYNFAIARVRLTGTAGPPGEATNVKVFFRVWGTQDADTEWDPSPTGTYAHVTDSSGNILGPAAPPSNHTIPFFATENPKLQDPDNPEFGPTGVNNTTIIIEQRDQQWTYYGCFLDVFDPNLQINGQYVNTLFPGTHHCLVAEINYAEAPIQTPTDGSVITPESSTSLAQRNLQITSSDNPGGPPAHRIPQTFSINLTRSGAPYVDQLMIDWGEVPVGSLASIYWPQLQASDIVDLSTKLYGHHPLSAADANTIQCRTVQGTTYIPIPIGVDEGTVVLAGLFTIDLPPNGVRAGQEFNVVVRKLRANPLPTSTTPPPPPKIPKIAKKRIAAAIGTASADAPTAGSISSGPPIDPSVPGSVSLALSPPTFSFAVVGSFNVRIPVSHGATLLRAESDTLAIMKARLGATPKSSIWYPVLERYVGYISGRVDGFGGSASSIPASFSGAPVPLPGPGSGHGNECCYCGKVVGICYNGLGHFDGFLLAVEPCQKAHKHPFEHLKPDCCKKHVIHEHRFHSDKDPIHRLVDRAWRHGTPVSVCSLVAKPHQIERLVLRAPFEFENDDHH